MNPEKKSKFGLKTVIIAAGVSLILGMMITARLDITGDSGAEGFWKENGTVRQVPMVGQTGLPSFVELAEKLSPAVVNISTTQVIKGRPFLSPSPAPGFRGSPFEEFFGDEFFKRFFGEQGGFKRQSLGSGFIINKDGYILTNNHVIEDASEIIVTFSDGKREYKAKIIGQDKNLDVALIKIDSENHLPVAVLGDSDKVKVGEWALAIGNPFGLGGTVTAGIVSQKGRFIGAGPYDDFIQTDASINPGNSGGPLFNLSGEVIGINTAIIAGGQGIGFATPINIIKENLLQLKDKGHITRGWIGVSIQELTPELSESLGIKGDVKGVFVTSVTPGTPAAKAGLEEEDVILEFNDRPITELNQLPRAVAATAPGTKAPVVVIRDGKRMTLTVTVGHKDGDEAEDEYAEKSGPMDGKGAVADRLGVTVKPVTPAVIERFELDPATKGVVITSIDPNSPAEYAGLRTGDVIQKVNRKNVAGVDEYRKEMKAIKDGLVMLKVLRGGSTIYVTIRIGG
jgi:serine protease Do